MTVNCAIYRDGEREAVEGDISDALDGARARGSCFIWIGMIDPSKEELDLVAEELKLHPLAVEDAANRHHRPKLERYDDTLLVVLKPLRFSDLGKGATAGNKDVEVGNIAVFLSEEFIVTVRNGQAGSLDAVRMRFEAQPTLFEHGPSAVLHAIFDEVVDRYGAVAHEIESEIIKLERRVFGTDRTQDVSEEIYDLKRDVLEFRSAEDPLIPVLRDITKGRAGVHPSTLEYFRDVLDHLVSVDHMIDSHNELLTNVLNAHLAHIGMQQNEDMRQIAAWAAMFAVPTMVAGIYGMNFEHMPELGWRVGYPLTMLLIVIVCIAMYRFFRKRGWL